MKYPQVASYRMWLSFLWKDNISLACTMKWWLGIHAQCEVGSEVVFSLLTIMSGTKKRELKDSFLYHSIMRCDNRFSARRSTNLTHKEGSGFVLEVLLMVSTWGRRLGKHPRLPSLLHRGTSRARGSSIIKHGGIPPPLLLLTWVYSNKETSGHSQDFRWIELPASNAALGCHAAFCLAGV